jgi:soluble P-type ATPase
MRSSLLDLHENTDLEKFNELMNDADVFFSNRRPGYQERYGLTADELCTKHPGLIHAKVTLCGDTGPWSNRTGYDEVAGAIAGIFALEGTPEKKALEIESLQLNHGKKVAMIGDGINDAPALTQADIGIAIGSGTDIAMAAGHIILLKSDLNHILYVIKLGHFSFRKIKQNLAMSFSYNVITISIAAGLIYGFTNSLILSPTLAALGWVLSDSAVFSNSLTIKRFVS